MSFNKYASRKIGDSAMEIIEKTARLRRLAMELEEIEEDGLFTESLSTADRLLQDVAVHTELLKASFAMLTRELLGLPPDENEDGEIEIVVRRNPDGSIKF